MGSTGSLCVLLSLCLLQVFAWADDTATRQRMQTRGAHFDRSAEFPNLYLEEKFRDVPYDQLVKTSEGRKALQKAVDLRNRALNSILKRITVPLFNDSNGKVEPQLYFYRMQQEIGEIDPRAKLAPSGGVVRSADGHLYQLMRDNLLKHGIPPEQTLRQVIANGEKFDPKKPDKNLLIEGWRVRGVGSDFDLLVDVAETDAEGKPRTPEQRRDLSAKIDQRAREMAEAVEKHYGLYGAKVHSGVKRTLVTILDVKNMYSILDSEGKIIAKGQLDRSVFGGGATIDLLYFDLDLENDEGGRLVSPDKARLERSLDPLLDGVKDLDPNERRRLKSTMLKQYEQFESIPQRLAAGESSYIEGHPEHFEKQAVRGIRALFELAHLEMDAESRRRLLADLDKVIATVNSAKADAETASDLFPKEGHKVIEQFFKTIRNARDGMANNRVHRATPDAEIENRIKALADATGQLQYGERHSLIPPYADRFPLGDTQRKVLGEHGCPADVCLTEKSLETRLPDGYLYHGTPDLDAALAILRGGFRETTYEKSFRRGTYTSPFESLSDGYARNSGVVLRLKLKQVPLRVLDLAAAREKHPQWMNKIEQEAQKKGIEAADLLAREYGVDLIILDENEILLKNVDAVEPSELKDLLYAYESHYRDTSRSPENRINGYRVHHRLHQLTQDVGEPGLRPPQDLLAFHQSLLEQSEKPPHHYAGFGSLPWDATHPQQRQIVESILNNTTRSPELLEEDEQLRRSLEDRYPDTDDLLSLPNSPADPELQRYREVRAQIEEVDRSIAVAQSIAANRDYMDPLRLRDLTLWRKTVEAAPHQFAFDLEDPEEKSLFIRALAKASDMSVLFEGKRGLQRFQSLLELENLTLEDLDQLLKSKSHQVRLDLYTSLVVDAEKYFKRFPGLRAKLVPVAQSFLRSSYGYGTRSKIDYYEHVNNRVNTPRNHEEILRRLMDNLKTAKAEDLGTIMRAIEIFLPAKIYYSRVSVPAKYFELYETMMDFLDSNVKYRQMAALKFFAHYAQEPPEALHNYYRDGGYRDKPGNHQATPPKPETIAQSQRLYQKRERIFSLLSSEDRKIQDLALKALNRTRGSGESPREFHESVGQHKEALLDALRHTDGKTRAEGLGILYDEELRADPEVRALAREAATDPEPQVRIAVLKLLSLISFDGPHPILEEMDLLEKMLADPDPEVRKTALDQVSHDMVTDPKIRKRLIALLEDKEHTKGVAAEAARLLREHARAGNALDMSVLRTAVDAMVTNPTGWKENHMTVYNNANERLREMIYMALGDNPELTEEYVKFIENADKATLRKLEFTFTRFRVPADVTIALLSRLEEMEEPGRALQDLPVLETRQAEAMEYLAPFTIHPDEDTRRTAVHHLVQIIGKMEPPPTLSAEAQEKLRQLFKKHLKEHGEEYVLEVVRSSAWRAGLLGQSGIQVVIAETLRELPELRSQAIKKLIEERSPRVGALLDETQPEDRKVLAEMRDSTRDRDTILSEVRRILEPQLEAEKRGAKNILWHMGGESGIPFRLSRIEGQDDLDEETKEKLRPLGEELMRANYLEEVDEDLELRQRCLTLFGGLK